MISSFSFGTAAGTSTAAWGSCKLILVSRMNVVETMRNSTSTSRTSTSEITLISGSSLERLCSLIGHSKNPGTLVLQQRFDEGVRLFLDQHDQTFDPAAQITIGNQRGDRDREARGRRDQRLRDAARENRRIACAPRGERRERADHARDGAEQSEQRRDRRDRAERPEITLELVHGVAADVLDALLDHLSRRVAVREARREY